MLAPLDNIARLMYKGKMSESRGSDEDKGTRGLSLRDFPVDLFWACKESAARQRKSLKEFVVEALRVAVKRERKERDQK
jgi:hypothetical protein